MEQVLYRQPSRPVIGLKRILLPAEHGGWSFLFEPLLVGLAIAPSPAAFWIATMAVAAFFARQPLKVYLQARSNPAAAGRALRFFLLFVIAAAAALGCAVLASGFYIVLPLAISLPLAAVQLRADAKGRSRSLAGELLGSAAISSSAAMILAAGGCGWASAAALWLIFSCRFAASIVYVRERLQLEKGKPHSMLVPAAANAAGFLIVGCLAYLHLASVITLGMFAFLLARAVFGLSSRRTPMKAMHIGIWELVYGVATALSIVLGHYVGL
jgi:hypothetical protein